MSCRMLFIMSLISFGVLVASYGEITIYWSGVVYQMGGVVGEALRLILMEILVKRKGIKLNLISVMYYVSPCRHVLLKDLIVQSLLRLKEPTALLRSQKEDLHSVNHVLASAKDEYAEKANVHSPEIIVDHVHLPPAPSHHHAHGPFCSGGVVLASRDGKIVFENTLDARLDVVFRKKLREHKVRLGKYKRDSVSIQREGEDVQAVWSPDAKLIAILTSCSYLQVFKVHFTEKRIQIGGKQPSGLFLATISLLLSEQVPFPNTVLAT